jgi:hypothetical protein
MHNTIHAIRPAAIARAATLLLVAGVVTAWLSSCATQNPTQPTPTATTNTVTLDEFYTPGPSGEADDYYVLSDGEDDVEYSYFLDEQDYLNARDMPSGNKRYIFIHDYVKHGHGYGDHNHIHEFVKGPHHYHGVYIGHRAPDWTDSLQLTTAEKLQIDSAMIHFQSCSKADVDSFRVRLKPYRDTFRVARIAILAQLDSGKITRDSARTLLDTAIVKYETSTQLLRSAFVADLTTCRTQLDVEIQGILTPTQYAIWVRHRGW